MSAGGADGELSGEDSGASASFWLFLRRRRLCTRTVVVAACEVGGGLMHRLILTTTYRNPPQQSMVIRSEVMALKKICGRLLITAGSSTTPAREDAEEHPRRSSLQYGSLQLMMVSFTKVLLMQLRRTFFLQLNSCSRSWQSGTEEIMVSDDYLTGFKAALFNSPLNAVATI